MMFLDHNLEPILPTFREIFGVYCTFQYWLNSVFTILEIFIFVVLWRVEAVLSYIQS